MASRLPRGLVLAACLLFVGVAGQAQTAFDYNTSPRTFRACRLLMPYPVGATWRVQASDNRSLMLEGMRRYPDKPSGWDLVNPLAPPVEVTGDPTHPVLPATPAANLPAGARGYWEVPLDAHPELVPTGATALQLPYANYNGPQLDKFDLLYVHIGGQDTDGNPMVLNLTRPEWRATLIRAVYNGAVLWIDQKRDNNGTEVAQFAPPGIALDLPGAPFWMTWANAAAGWYRHAAANDGSGTATNSQIKALAKDRLLSYPFLLQNARDIPYLGRIPSNIGGAASVDRVRLPDLTTALPAALADASSWQRVVNVCNENSLVAADHIDDDINIAVARCGAGAIVLTAGDVGWDVIDWWFGQAQNRPLQQQAADCKFAWNVAALAGSFGQAQGNSAAQGASVTATPPPMGISWQYPDRFDNSGANAIGPVVGAPVVNKGMAYVVSLPLNGNSGRLMCFDTDPASDLDNDGNADDGDMTVDANTDGVADCLDYSLGRSYDMVWSVNLPAGQTPRTAGPCVATLLWPVPVVAATTPTDVVLLSTVAATPGGGAAGHVLAYNAHTGAGLWTRDLTPYTAGTGRVVDLSAPVVYRDTVFVLASEYDNAIDAGNGTEDTYGRVHAFGLDYNWSAGVAGPQWVYPDPEADPSHGQDPDNAPGPGVNPDHANPETGRSLPPFQDPAWVLARGSGGAGAPQLPPYPTPRPTVALPSGTLSRPGVDLLLQCSTPVSLMWAGAGTAETDTDPSVGGSDYVFVPAPYDAVNNRYTLNRHAYSVWLPQGVTPAQTRFSGGVTAVHREDDANITSTGNVPVPLVEFTWRDPADGRVYADFLPGAAREFLLPSLNLTAAVGSDPCTLALGAPIAFDYQTGAAFADLWHVAGWLPGPVAQVTRAPLNQRRASSWSVNGGTGVYATDAAESNVGLVAGEPGSIACREVATGGLKWEFRTNAALTVVGGALPLVPAQLAKGGAASERNNDTVYAAVTATRNPAAGDLRVRVPQVLGLDADPRLRVRLAGPTDSEISSTAAFTITTVGADGVTAVPVPQTTTDAAGAVHTIYTVDRPSRTILFSSDEAGWVAPLAGAAVGPLWGKPIWVDYERVNPAATPTPPSELHVLQDILRFQYSPGIVRLQHGMIGYNGDPMVTFALPNGVPVVPNSDALNEVAFTALTAGLPAGWTGVLPRGIIDVSDLRLPSGEVVLPGSDVVATYHYYDDLTGTDVTAHELCQVPVNFGASSAPVVLADRTVHVGTEGYRPDGMRGVGLLPSDSQQPNPALGVQPLFNSVRRSFLSVVLDPITRIVRGALSQPAIPEAAGYALEGTPVVEGAAGVDSGGLLVGSNMLTALSRSAPDASGYRGQGLGFVSRLKTERTLVCDNTRLVETVAGKPSWVCVGSHAAAFHESLNADALPLDLADAYLDNQDRKVTAFSRPAKALYLSNGNILVADSGNDRVIEIDRTGKQVWPLDAPDLAATPAYLGGYDFYTSKRNSILDLQRPSDCFRYYVEYRVGSAPRTSVNGSPLAISRPNPAAPGTWTGTEIHTVIADAGHKRVVDVVTYLDPLGVQTHRVDILTPSAVRIGTQQTMTQLSYTKARPIFDPNNGNVTGYLCAAANMHQLAVVERGTRLVDPPANRLMPDGSGGTWEWLAWLYDSDLTDANYAPSNPLVFRNIRDVELSYEGTQVFLTVTCGQYAGRLSNTAPNGTPHPLALQGAGVFEFCLQQGGGGLWGRVLPSDANPGDSLPVTGDDPIWWFTRLNWLYSSFNYDAADASYVYGDLSDGLPTRRTISNLRYADVDNTVHWLDMAWNPVSAIRLPADRRPVGAQRQARHLVTNAAEIIQNLSRDNVRSAASIFAGPAALFSTVFVVNSDDAYDASPDNDTHDLDRREAIPNPQEADWTDPFNQPTFADRQ